MDELEQQIDKVIGEIRSESVDFSFGELVSLHERGELLITPEYQRLFRWSDTQKSRLIESVLVELPVPPIFVIENQDGVYELIDGLQRISSVFQFIQPHALNLEPLTLVNCELITKLNGMTFKDLPLALQLRLKRSPARTIVIKRQSQYFLRYEMFKRLNTGGSLLSSQEVRNVSARMLGEEGIYFYEFLITLCKNESFLICTSTMAQEDADQKGNEELVLRFFAAKNAIDMFKGSVRDWLDGYMEAVLLEKANFDYQAERKIFEDTFTTIRTYLGENAFVKYRGQQPIGGLAPAYFEAVSIAFQRQRNRLIDAPLEPIRQAIIQVLQSPQFRAVTGPGANSKQKLDARISLVENAIKEATQ